MNKNPEEKQSLLQDGWFNCENTHICQPIYNIDVEQ